MPTNKILNPVVQRWNRWKQDKWSLLEAAQSERQRLMQEIAQRQEVVQQLTQIIDGHGDDKSPVPRDWPQEPMEQS